MSHRFIKKYKPFIELPKHRRKDTVFYLKKEIERNSEIFGGEFSSYLMPEDEPDFNTQWFPIFFLGIGQYTFWNARVETARNAFADEVEILAYKRIMSMLTPEEYEAGFSIKYEPATISNTGKVLSYHVVRQEPIKYEKLGGLTVEEKMIVLKFEIVDKTPPKIYEIFRHDYTYRSGIRLHIIVDADVINREVIECVIAKFRSLGEMDWQSPQSISSETLFITNW